MPSLATASNSPRSRFTECELPHLAVAPSSLLHADGAGMNRSLGSKP